MTLPEGARGIAMRCSPVGVHDVGPPCPMPCADPLILERRPAPSRLLAMSLAVLFSGRARPVGPLTVYGPVPSPLVGYNCCCCCCWTVYLCENRPRPHQPSGVLSTRLKHQAENLISWPLGMGAVEAAGVAQAEVMQAAPPHSISFVQSVIAPSALRSRRLSAGPRQLACHLT